MTEKKNNPIDSNLEKISVPQRNGDDIVTDKSKTPSGDKLAEGKKREEYTSTRPQTQKIN